MYETDPNIALLSDIIAAFDSVSYIANGDLLLVRLVRCIYSFLYILQYTAVQRQLQ